MPATGGDPLALPHHLGEAGAIGGGDREAPTTITLSIGPPHCLFQGPPAESKLLAANPDDTASCAIHRCDPSFTD